MFTKKQEKLFETKNVSKTSVTNAFVNTALKNDAVVASGNGAKKYSTTGNPFVDQFGKVSEYRVKRSFNDIVTDCETLWAENKKIAVLFIFYLRIITRVVTLFNGTKTSVSQKGAGLKHESIMRMIWLHMKQPITFWKNIDIFISVGSWKDIITMLSYDLQYNGWNDRKLDWNKFGNLILNGLNDPSQRELLKKYLPQIKANSKCSTLESQADNIIGKWICSLLYGSKMNEAASYKLYRKLKVSGTAHEWQQLISKRKFEKIDFNKIHGRALSLLVRGKFLKNQGLETKYNEWITKPTTTSVKYTGFVHELFSICSRYSSLIKIPANEQETINKQFQTLIEKGGEKVTNTKLIVVRDTSSSMGSLATGLKMSCFDVAKALALYFSEFLTGAFKDAFIEFNSDAKMHTWKGNTPLEKWYNDHCGFVGSTNFMSVIQLFAKLKRQGVPENEFPTGILCISDMEFNPVSAFNKTNVEVALDNLRSAGFSENYVQNFVIVLWNLRNDYYGAKSGIKFDTYGNVPNVYYFSGFEPSIISFLTEDIKNAEELFDAAMNQEVLNLITI